MNSKSTWIERVGKRGCDLKDAPTQLLGDEDVVCAAVKKDYNAFQYASPLLQNDKKFLMEKLIPLSLKSPWALRFASSELRKDKEVVKKAVHYNFISFKFANSELKDDRDFVKELVQLKRIRWDRPPAYALDFASRRLKNDKEVVLAAVKNVGGALEYASDELRNDREFCLECVKIGGERAFKYVSEELKEEYETKEEFMKKISSHPNSESMKNEGTKKEIDTNESVVRAEEPKAVSMPPKSLLKKMENDTTESSVRAEEPKMVSIPNSMETNEYKKQIEELRKALSRGEEERRAEVDALRVELENREKLIAKSGVEKQAVENENEKLEKDNKKLEKEIKSLKKENQDNRLLSFERSLMGKSFNDFKIVKVLGKSTGCVVLEVTIADTVLAMKILYNYQSIKNTALIGKEYINREFVYSLPSHPCLLRLHFCFIGNFNPLKLQSVGAGVDNFFSTKAAIFIMPKCDGTLDDLMEKKMKQKKVYPIMSKRILLKMLDEVVSGLIVLKENGIIHCDLKPNNIFFRENQFLVGDFGECLRSMDHTISYNSRTRLGGNYSYMPP